MKTQHEKESVSIYDNYKLDSEIKNTDEKYYFIFNERELLLINNHIPLIKDFNEININKKDIKNCLYIGEYYSKDCFAVELNEYFNSENYIETNKDSEFLDLYFVYDIDEETYLIAGRAIQIIDWENNHQYCGRCGTKTFTSDVENAKVCPNCGFTYVPVGFRYKSSSYFEIGVEYISGLFDKQIRHLYIENDKVYGFLLIPIGLCLILTIFLCMLIYGYCNNDTDTKGVAHLINHELYEQALCIRKYYT